MLKKFLEIIKQKHQIEKKQDRYEGHKSYFQGLQEEIEEVKVEIKDNNSVYLEDELGHILRDYFNLLETLTSEGKITSPKKVITRAEQKYTERIEAITNTEFKISAWDNIKKQQKEKLKQEHRKKYGEI